MHFCDFWMIRHYMVRFPNVGKHLVLSRYAISSWSNRPNSRKRPKPSVLALWIIQKCIFVIFEWSSMSHIMAKLLRPFSIIKICNIKSIQQTKLEKMAKNLFLGSLDLTLRTLVESYFSTFWWFIQRWLLLIMHQLWLFTAT